MLGVFAGRWLMEKRRPLVERVVGLYGAGSLGMILGSLWGAFLPHQQESLDQQLRRLHRRLRLRSAGDLHLGHRSPSRTMVDESRSRCTASIRWWRSSAPASWPGSSFSLIKVHFPGVVSLQQASYQLLFEPFFPDRLASLLWGLCFVGFLAGHSLAAVPRNIVVKV